jgi:hypothetical protein
MNGYAGETRTSAPITWTERTLECQGMPPEEIDSILATDDPEVVRRYLELHREWLEERLADRLRELDAVESQLLAEHRATRGDLTQGPRTRLSGRSQVHPVH